MSKECVGLDLNNQKSKDIINLIFDPKNELKEDMTEFYIIGTKNVYFNIKSNKISEETYEEIEKNVEDYIRQKFETSKNIKTEIKDRYIHADLEKNRFYCTLLVTTSMFKLFYDCIIKWYNFYNQEKRTEYASSNVIYVKFLCLKINSISDAFDFIVDNKNLLIECIKEN
ncbi:MAG: hypothetical protein NZZ41_07535 [Candidatus Dojkabacteria bacterium]|nr:hypothetical protein [Candidatus Dojkabacteria bacterium]